MIVEKRLLFKVLSPLHIGSGANFYPFEYVKFGEHIYFINESKFINFLKKENLLDDYIKAFTTERQKFSISDYLRHFSLLNEDILHEISQYRVRHSLKREIQISKFIKDHEMKPYIPGSSVKGAIRVAILYYILKNLPSDKKEQLIDKPIRRKLSELKRDRRKKGWIKKHLGDEIDRILQKFQLTDKNHPGPNTDILKALIVRDSAPLSQDVLEVKMAEIVNLNGKNQSIPTGIEIIRPGTTFYINISIDTSYLDYFRKAKGFPLDYGKLEEVIFNPIKATEFFITNMMREDTRVLKNDAFKKAFPVPETPNFRFGWGKGILYTTVFQLLDEDLKRKIRDIYFTRRGRSNDIFPVSRKIVEGQLMGFCHVTIE